MRPDKRDARFCVPDLNEEEEICDFIALRVEYNWYMMRTGNEKGVLHRSQTLFELICLA